MTKRSEELRSVFEGICDALRWLAGTDENDANKLINAATALGAADDKRKDVKSRLEFARRHRSKLHVLRQIRNVAIHNPLPFDPAPPTAELISEAHRILNKLNSVAKSGELGVPAKKVFAPKPDQKIHEIVEIMRSNLWTHAPILDDNQCIVGVFSESTLFEQLGVDGEVILDGSSALETLFEHCRISEAKSERFVFVKPDTLVDELVKLLTTTLGKTARIGACFVTVDGSQNAPMQRLITPWDVLAR